MVETRPGRIEAVVLAPAGAGSPDQGPLADGARGREVEGAAGREVALAREAAHLRAELEAAVKTANRALSQQQRIAAWRLWPEADFPRTHTLKVKRDQIRAWVAVDQPLPVSEETADGR